MKRSTEQIAAGPPLHFKIGEIPIALQSDMDELREEFAALYHGSLQAGPPQDDAIAMDVTATGRGLLRGRRWAVCGDGEKISTVRRWEELMPYLEWGINYRVIASRRRFLQLHAATLVRHGQGVLFAATSGAGKSTLAAGLLARGWKYLSDEFALIDPETLCIHPFPKALCIKAGAFDVVEQAGLPLWRRRYYVKAFKGRVGYVCPEEVRPDALAGPAPIRFVFFPRYIDGTEPRIVPVSRAAAAFSLSGFVLNHGAFGGRAASTLASVAGQALSFRLESGPLTETCELIESVVD